MFDAVLFVDNGFKIVERQQTMDIQRAVTLLSRRGQRKFTSAAYDGEQATQATLTSHYVHCPCCESWSLAYSWNLYRDAFIRLPKEKIESWADQMSLFPTDSTLLLPNKVCEADSVTCPKCGRTSFPYTQQRTVQIRIEGKKIMLTTEMYGEIPLMLLARTHRLPIHQTAVFNTKKGRVYLRITDDEGSILKTRDVTAANKEWKESVVRELLDKHAIIRRKLAAAFRLLWPATSFPFSNKELTPKDFISMTRFWGYPTSWYAALPYDSEDDDWIEESFQLNERWYHTPDKLPALYDSTTLPRAKSIRRIFFQNVEVFIYVRELEILWNLLKDVNRFHQMLERCDLFRVLSFMHTYPAAALEFFRDYADIKGKEALLKIIDLRWLHVQDYACKYYAQTPAAREKARKSWRNDQNAIVRRTVVPFAVPEISTVQDSGKAKSSESIINGYSIAFLRTQADYIRAGSELDNCLAEYTSSDHVAVIKKGRSSRCCAAFEVSGNTIIQARGPHNLPLEKELEAVLNRWAQRNHYQINLKNDVDAYIDAYIGHLLNAPD